MECVAAFGAGGGNYGVLIVVLVNGNGNLCFHGFAADGAGKQLNADCSFGGLFDDFAIIPLVPLSLNDLAVLNGFTAVLADSVGGIAVSGAGGGFGVFFLEGVAQRVDEAILKGLTASAFVEGIAAVGAVGGITVC